MVLRFSIFEVSEVPIFNDFGFFPWLLKVALLHLKSHRVFVPIVVAIGNPITLTIPRLGIFSLPHYVRHLLNRNIHFQIDDTMSHI